MLLQKYRLTCFIEFEFGWAKFLDFIMGRAQVEILAFRQVFVQPGPGNFGSHRPLGEILLNSGVI